MGRDTTAAWDLGRSKGTGMHTRAMIAYAGRGIPRPRYYANDHGRDVLDIAAVEMDIADEQVESTGGIDFFRSGLGGGGPGDRGAVDHREAVFQT